MSRLVKEMIVDELKSRYTGKDSAVWVEVVGIDGIQTNEFRRALHARKMQLEVVKTALLRRAIDDQPLGRLARELTGPAALITGGDSAVEIAKLIDEWLPRIKTLKLRGALLEGELIPASAVANLSKMPSRRDLQARVAGCVRSPGASLAAAILSGGGRAAGAIKTLIEKLEKGETIQRVAG
jgi:large subunit ribosomal protein L10